MASGEKVPGDRLLRAARLALAGRDPDLAIRLLEAGGEAGLSSIDRAEVAIAAHSMSGALEEAHVVDSVWDEDLDDARAQLAKHVADIRYFRDRDLDGALAAYESARERLTDPEAIAAVDARRANLLAGSGRPAEALRITEAMGPSAPAHPRSRSPAPSPPAS